MIDEATKLIVIDLKGLVNKVNPNDRMQLANLRDFIRDCCEIYPKLEAPMESDMIWIEDRLDKLFKEQFSNELSLGEMIFTEYEKERS